jgi:hypothetical protein
MAITFGSATAPSQVITNLDALFSLSVANYRKTFNDNIGSTNAFLFDLLKSGAYESADGGTYLAEPLMYAFPNADTYDGYGELSTAATEGITQILYEWRQMAIPIVYSMKEVIQNQHKLADLVRTKITQSEMGLKESFAQHMWWGAYPNGGALTTARTSTINGSSSINPLPLLVSYNSSSLTVGNLAEASYGWWKNRSATSTASTYAAFIYELINMYNLCSLGTGGAPTHIVMDQISYQLFCHAYFATYKMAPGATDQNYHFEAKVVMDDKVPDVYTGSSGTEVAGVVDPTTMTYGTAYFLNENFFKLRYHPSRDWSMLENEEGKTFAKPINGDSRVGHIAWMGNLTVNNRRKHGVLGKIARSLT